jgi:hypothetical protein
MISDIASQLKAGTTPTDSRFELFQNSPNPFIEMTLLYFRLPAATDVALRIFNAAGNEISTKVSNCKQGENHFVLHRSDLREPGFYTCRLETPYGTASRKLMMY